MFFKRRKKKRVICPIPVLLGIIQESIDVGASFVILFYGKEYKIGLDFEDYVGYPPHGTFINPIFYLEEQEFDNFEAFKSQAMLEGRLLVERTEEVEVIEIDSGVVKLPSYNQLEQYVVEE